MDRDEFDQFVRELRERAGIQVDKNGIQVDVDGSRRPSKRAPKQVAGRSSSSNNLAQSGGGAGQRAASMGKRKGGQKSQQTHARNVAKGSGGVYTGVHASSVPEAALDKLFSSHGMSRAVPHTEAAKQAALRHQADEELLGMLDDIGGGCTPPQPRPSRTHVNRGPVPP